MDSNEQLYKQIIESYSDKCGLKANVSCITKVTNEILSDARSSVRLVTVEYLDKDNRTHTERIVERKYASQKYDDYDDKKVNSETNIFVSLSETFRKMGFNALPIIYNSTGAGRDTVYHMQYVGDYNLSELYPIMDGVAWNTEKMLATNGPIAESSIDSRIIELLDANRRVEHITSGDKMYPTIKLKDKFLRRYEIRRKQVLEIAPYETEITADFQNAFDLVAEFQRRLLLWKERGTYNPSGVLVQNENYLVAEFNTSLSRINRSVSEDKRVRAIDLYSQLFIPRIAGTKQTLIHGDCSAPNIIKGPEGYKGFFIVDIGHISEGCPLVDFADFITYGRNFCGMSDTQEDDLWEQGFQSTGINDRNLRDIVNASRAIRVAGVLNKRIHQVEEEANTFLSSHLTGMKYRLPKYEELLKDFFNSKWRTVFMKSSDEDKKSMEEFSKLMLENYFPQK